MQTGQKEQTRNGSRNKVQTRRGAPIVVHGIVRPKPDLNKLLRAMIEMAWDEQDKDDQSKS
jgi:hypothetical protein